MTGRGIPYIVLQNSGGLAKQDFSKVVLKEKRIRHSQTREELDDVAVEQHRLAPARGGIRAVLQVHVVHDDELGVQRIAGTAGAEEPEERTVRTQDARQLIRELGCRRLVEVIDQVPAENAVDAV